MDSHVVRFNRFLNFVLIKSVCSTEECGKLNNIALANLETAFYMSLTVFQNNSISLNGTSTMFCINRYSFLIAEKSENSSWKWIRRGIIDAAFACHNNFKKDQIQWKRTSGPEIAERDQIWSFRTRTATLWTAWKVERAVAIKFVLYSAERNIEGKFCLNFIPSMILI